LRPINGICIIFIAGYSTIPAIPKSWKQAMLLLIGHLYEHREDVITGTIVSQMPLASQHLLWKDRLFL